MVNSLNIIRIIQTIPKWDKVLMAVIMGKPSSGIPPRTLVDIYLSYRKLYYPIFKVHDTTFHSSPSIKIMTDCTKNKWMANKAGNMQRGWDLFNVLYVQYIKTQVLIFCIFKV